MKREVAKWKDAARCKGVDPQVAAKVFQRVANKGDLTPEAVLSEASKKRNPLHKFFEWDDSVAGRKFRLEQARYLIRSLEITVESAGRPEVSVTVRKYVSLGRGVEDGKESKFHNINVVMSETDLRDQLIRKLWNEMLAAKQKYSHIIEFKPIWDAIGEVQDKVMRG